MAEQEWLKWLDSHDGQQSVVFRQHAETGRVQRAIADYLNALEQSLREAEQKLKQAAETYVVALDVSEQTWRKELEATKDTDFWTQQSADLAKERDAAEQRAERYRLALVRTLETLMVYAPYGEGIDARAALAEPQAPATDRTA